MSRPITRERLQAAFDTLHALYNARAAAGHSRVELEPLANAALVALQEYESFCELEDARPALKPLAKVLRMQPLVPRVYRLRGKP